MDDPGMTGGGLKPRGLFAGAPGEGGREPAFQKRRTGQVRLQPADLESDTDFAGSGHGSKSGPGRGWGARAGLALIFTGLAGVLALAAGHPGAAAGLIALPLPALSVLAGLAAAAAGAAAFVCLVGAVRRAASARAPAPTRLARRPVFVGTGAYEVQIGEEGLAFASSQRRFTAYWSAFDTKNVYARAMNPPGLPMITKAEAGAAGFDAVFGPPGDNPALEALVEQAASWARANPAIRLALKADPKFLVRATKTGDKRLAPASTEFEYLYLSRRLFEDGGGDLSWPGFVAAAILMMSRHDPGWVNNVDPPAPPQGS
ncbi:MAG: hypothetical protein RIA71_02735 [Oceanicaulis sp.]